MPPREASGSFPDQFLLFDYDAVVAPAAAAVTTPPPPQTTTATTTTAQHIAAQHHQQQQPTTPPTPPLHNQDAQNIASSLAGLEGSVDSPSTAAGTANTLDQQQHHHQLNPSAPSPVDPLSIDPTNHHRNSHSDSSNSSFPTQTAVSTPHQLHVVSSSASSASSNSGGGAADSPLSTGSSIFYNNNHARHHAQHSQPQPQHPAGASPAPSLTLTSATTPSTTTTDASIGGVAVSASSSSSTSSSARQRRRFTSSLVTEDSPSQPPLQPQELFPPPPPPPPEHSSASMVPSILSTGSEDSSDSMRMIYRNAAFDGTDPGAPSLIVGTPTNMLQDEDDEDEEEDDEDVDDEEEQDGGAARLEHHSPKAIMLSFGPNTTVDDLKYFAERGCIVALLEALTTPRLVTLGTRMLADYAKMAHRRVAVASNKRILDFCQQTMLQISPQDHAIYAATVGGTTSHWIGREYAVETVRSLTATEASDQYLMNTPGLLKTLALVSIGGPFLTANTTPMTDSMVLDDRGAAPLASEKAQLHACIAIMNLSCGKSNKMEIAQVPAVLEAMRDVMMGPNEEACLKATTCIKNLSNADANDAALLTTPGLVEALGHVAATTCASGGAATVSTTNACLALMNLSISKANKHRVFRTPGVMEALMQVLERTTPQPNGPSGGPGVEARVKACSALSNLAIGYDNKIPMFHFPGFVPAILSVISTDRGEARTKACSILWSFAAEIKNQIPVVERGDILPVLVRVAQEDATTEARFKCVAALTLLAESLENAVPLLHAGALVPLMDILQQAGADPTQWKGQTASWCVGFLMNISQSDEAVSSLRQAGIVELLAPLLTLDHYQSLKAAMAVTFCCRFDKGDECYDLLRKTESVIPKIINLLHNTLAGRGGNGYKYGVFTLRSSVGCIAALACGPDFMKERIATALVFESLLRVVSDFCVDGGTAGAIVGGGRDDVTSAKLAVQALQALTAHLIPNASASSLPFGAAMEERLLTAFECYIASPDVHESSRQLAMDAKYRMEAARAAAQAALCKTFVGDDHDVASMASNCCGALEYFPGLTMGGDDDEEGDSLLQGLYIPSLNGGANVNNSNTSSPKSLSHLLSSSSSPQQAVVRTFLLADSATGLRFVVPTDPSGGRFFNDGRLWCYRRGRYCVHDEVPDPAYVWTESLQRQYEVAVSGDGIVADGTNATSMDGTSSNNGGLVLATTRTHHRNGTL